VALTLKGSQEYSYIHFLPPPPPGRGEDQGPPLCDKGLIRIKSSVMQALRELRFERILLTGQYWVRP